MNKIDKKLHFLLGKVKEECKKVKELSDYELKNKTLEFKERLNNGETTDDILPEAFAVCCEADYRVLGMFPYDVQILHSSLTLPKRKCNFLSILFILPFLFCNHKRMKMHLSTTRINQLYTIAICL